MARRSLFLFLILTTCWHSWLKAQEETFLRAQELYRQGEYSKALDSCMSLTAQGPAVWHTMGYCAYKMKDYCRAHLFFKRAQQGAPPALYSSIDAALCDLYTQLGCSDSAPANGILQMIRRYTNHIPLWSMQCACIILWYFMVIMVLIKKRIRRFVLVCTIGLISACGVILAVRYYDQHVVQAIVMRPSTLYAGPDEKYHTVETMREAECVQVMQEYASWYKVQRIQGAEGWLLKEALILV